LCCFGVLGREPPGGTLPAARRRLGVDTSFWIWDEGPGGANPAARRHERKGLIFFVFGVLDDFQSKKNL